MSEISSSLRARHHIRNKCQLQTKQANKWTLLCTISLVLWKADVTKTKDRETSKINTPWESIAFFTLQTMRTKKCKWEEGHETPSNLWSTKQYAVQRKFHPKKAERARKWDKRRKGKWKIKIGNAEKLAWKEEEEILPPRNWIPNWKQMTTECSTRVRCVCLWTKSDSPGVLMLLHHNHLSRNAIVAFLEKSQAKLELRD